jgi:hypothetical protein
MSEKEKNRNPKPRKIIEKKKNQNPPEIISKKSRNL